MAQQRARWGTRHFRRASIVTAVTAGMLTVTALAGMSTSTSAVPMVVTTPPATTATLPPVTAATAGGWLTLETGLTNRVTYDANRDLTPEAVQTLTGNSTTCLMSTDQSLLKISGYVGSGTTNLASLKGGKIGVASSALGAACYQVNAPLERLDLELANPSLSISSALLDIEIKASARILATTSYKGTVTGYFQLQSGSTIGASSASLPGGVTPNATFTCVGKYDDDKDHGLDDDCRWPISTPSWNGDDGVYFDKISLQAVNGKFSLEGGADGDVPSAPPAGFPRRASLFELSASLISCNASTTTLPAELNAPEVTVRRLANADATTCTPIPISVTHGPLSATILKPLAQQTTAQFVLDIVWTLPVDASGTASTTATRMNYQSSPTSPDIPLNWCPNPTFDGPKLVGIQDPLLQQDQDGILNGIQFSCVGTSNTVVVNPPTGDDYLQITEQIYLEGDAYASRGGG